MARIYRAKVTELATALQEPDSRCEATEALRGLVDAIVLTPDQRRGRRIPTTSPRKYLWLRGLATNIICSCGGRRRDDNVTVRPVPKIADQARDLGAGVELAPDRLAASTTV